MKRSKLGLLAATAVGVFLARGAQADTILTFDALPSGQGQNASVLQGFGDNVGSAGPGTSVEGFGTPDIALTWGPPGPGSPRWDYYIDAVWSAGQLDGSAVDTSHTILFTPTPSTAVSVKSFNFHPYYANGLNYAYDWSVLDGNTVLASGALTFDCDATKNHPVEINYSGNLGQSLTLRITRTGGSDGTQNIAVDDIRFAQLPEPAGPFLASVSPANNQNPTRPDAVFSAVITNGPTALAAGSVQLRFNGAPVLPTVTPLPNSAAVSFQPASLLPSGSTNRYTLTYDDTAMRHYTNEVQFVIVPYTDIQLPPPIYLETFDDVPEGGLPAGWAPLTYTAGADPNFDPSALSSATYSNWVVVNSARFTGPLTIYGGPDTTEDYQRVLSFNLANVENGQVVESLAQNNILFGNSGYRSEASQVLFCFTRDYDLSGRTNVFISFHSLYEQNQDSIGAVEYSINEGATWLPVAYLLDVDDVVLDTLDNVDAVATMTDPQGDTATYTDPVTMEPRGGFYGAFIGAAISQDLAPYISGRINDDPVESKRVELFRLPDADNQAKVRFRFAYAGTDSWYFGMDNFGIYSLPTVAAFIAAQLPARLRMSAGSIASLTVQAGGTPPFTYQWRSNGVDIAGATGPKLVITNLQASHNAAYSVRVSNAGGAAVGTTVLEVFEPRITGHWDFDEGDLRASTGAALEFRGNTAGVTTFTTSFFPVEFEDAHVMCFPTTEITQGYVIRHGALPNGGGGRVNQYTLLMDLRYPAASAASWRALLQADPQNSNGDDADLYVNPSGGIGSGQYDGTINADTWHRIAFVVDLAAPSSQRLTKFIDGVKVGTQSLPGADGQHSLDTTALLFTTGDRSGTYTAPGCVNSIQFVDGRLSDDVIAGLGAPVANGLPLFDLKVERTGNSITIRWKGAATLLLQRATRLTNPDWDELPQTLGTSSYTEPIGNSPAFFRLAPL
jgi:hypothetical protein